MHKILLIEDDAPTRKLTSQVLRYADFEVLEAADGKLGVEAALAAIPDLIVCDMMMPELDGMGVLQALRESPSTALIPFIFLTAKVEACDQRQGMEEGADDYLTKPYSADTLISSVKRRLEKRSRQVADSRRQTEEISLAVAASVPHEMVATLNQLTSLSSLVAGRYAETDPDVAAAHRRTMQQAERMRRMMRRLHLYSQLPHLYANRFHPIHGQDTVETANVVERVARSVAAAWHREADLRFRLQNAILPMRVEYLELLIEELVENACKFSELGTPVELTASARPEFWSVEVRNQGAGLTPAQINQLGAFKQFWHGSARPPGLGLGLALTQGIARLHGAEFSLHSDQRATGASILIPLQH